jgi:hypothetical protein
MTHAGCIIVGEIGPGAHGPERRPTVSLARRPVGTVTQVPHFHGRLTPRSLRPGTFRISVAQDKLASTLGERAPTSGKNLAASNRVRSGWHCCLGPLASAPVSWERHYRKASPADRS